MKLLRKFLSGIIFLGCAASCTNIEYEVDKPVMFRGDSGHNGIYDGRNIGTLDETVWKFKTEGKIVSSPIVYGGSAYVGSGDSYLYAIDVVTGEQRWRFKTGGDVASSPAAGRGIVYFNSRDGNFYAVDARSGNEVWKFTTSGESLFSAVGLFGYTPKDKLLEDPWDVFLSSPAISGETVYFGSGDGHIYALDSKSGEQKWKFKTGKGVHSSPAVSDGIVYCGSWDSKLYALDAETGEEIWSFDTGQDENLHVYTGVQSSPLVVNGTVYIGTRSGFMMAFDDKTGEKKWEFSTEGNWVVSSPAVVNGLICFGTSDSFKFIVLDAETGELKHEFVAGAWVFSSPAISGETAHFGSFGGRLFTFNVRTGVKTGEFVTDASRDVNLITPDGKLNPELFGRPEDPNNMHAFIRDVLIGRMFAAGSIASSPVISDGVLYFGSTDGYLYALR